MHERRFNREIERLRDPQRVARLEVDRVVQLALQNLAGGLKVLDIGSGSGLFAEKFAALGLDIQGVDANPDMLPAARNFVPAGIFQEAVAEKLPFEAGEFDLVFMGLVLHETDDLAAALSEAFRVSTRRAAILEWPYMAQEFGPPLSDRIPQATLTSLASQAGFPTVEVIPLERLVFYRLDH